jgi:hypothetical protein
MSKQAKELKKAYEKVIEDIFDNYDKYTDDEKVKVQQQLKSLDSLNSILEKYDKKWRNPFQWIADLFNNATGKK